MTNLETQVTKAISEADHYNDLPCMCFSEILEETNIGKNILKGVLGSLSQKGLIEVSEYPDGDSAYMLLEKTFEDETLKTNEIKEEKLLKNWEALKAFEEGEKVEYKLRNTVPAVWEEYKYMLNLINPLTDSDYIFRIKPKELPTTFWEAQEGYNFPGKDIVAYVSLRMLEILRDIYNEKKPIDWMDGLGKYTIEFGEGRITRDYWITRCRFLAFHSEKKRDLFLENFRDLILNAKPLL